MDQDETQTHETPPTESYGGLSRRRVVGTAATAAWTAPLIVAATAAPAYAVSDESAPAAIATTIGLITRVGNVVKVPVTFTNAGGPTTGLVAEVIITVPAGGINQTQPTVLSAGWVRSREATVLLTNRMDVQFSKVAPQIGGTVGVNNTSLLEFDFNAFFQNGLLDGNVTVNPTVAGAPGSTASGASQAFVLNAVGPQPRG